MAKKEETIKMIKAYSPTDKLALPNSLDPSGVKILNAEDKISSGELITSGADFNWLLKAGLIYENGYMEVPELAQ